MPTSHQIFQSIAHEIEAAQRRADANLSSRYAVVGHPWSFRLWAPWI
jgi:hypothetical protein